MSGVRTMWGEDGVSLLLRMVLVCEPSVGKLKSRCCLRGVCNMAVLRPHRNVPRCFSSSSHCSALFKTCREHLA